MLAPGKLGGGEQKRRQDDLFESWHGRFGLVRAVVSHPSEPSRLNRDGSRPQTKPRPPRTAIPSGARFPSLRAFSKNTRTPP